VSPGDATTRRALLGGLAGALVWSADGPAGAADRVAIEGRRALRDVERLVALGPRPPGSPAAQRARAYIRDELRQARWQVREHAFVARTPRGPIPMTNVIAEWPGRRPDIVAVGGHYDTKVFDAFRFVGANDGGSSTALLLELGRALGARYRSTPPPYARWLVFFDGEEAQREWTATDSLYGSRALVADLRASGALARLRALIVADMIGDRDLGIRRETGSTGWLTDLVWGVAGRLGYGAHFLEDRRAVTDDHAPFLDAGTAATLLIDFDYGGGPGENRFWHTPHDTLDKVSADSLRLVGEVIAQALAEIDAELARRSP
jgi:Zn-dependent M28 family amino/carboxypeptidase